MYASLLSIGSYAPEYILTNAELEQTVETSDEWIVKRTGISERRIAKGEHCSDMGAKAAKIAIERSGLALEEIDAVITATISPDYLCMPSTACVIADKLGIKNVPAFDISAACSGFIYLLSIAKSYIESGAFKNILIIGTEKLSAITDYEDRGTCILFGDGAGAAVIGRCKEKKQSVLDVKISADGSFGDLLITPGCGSSYPLKDFDKHGKKPYMQMAGNEIFKLAVKTLANDVHEILQKNAVQPKDVTYFIPHQANLRIITAVGKQLDFADEQIALTVQKYGNTSSASIPMAIDDLYTQGKIKNGDLLLLDAFGGGLTWGSSLLYFNGN